MVGHGARQAPMSTHFRSPNLHINQTNNLQDPRSGLDACQGSLRPDPDLNLAAVEEGTSYEEIALYLHYYRSVVVVVATDYWRSRFYVPQDLICQIGRKQRVVDSSAKPRENLVANRDERSSRTTTSLSDRVIIDEAKIDFSTIRRWWNPFSHDVYVEQEHGRKWLDNLIMKKIAPREARWPCRYPEGRARARTIPTGAGWYTHTCNYLAEAHTSKAKLCSYYGRPPPGYRLLEGNSEQCALTSFDAMEPVKAPERSMHDMMIS
ncbi:uncharacterized protein MYCFIDRAFT_206393 [Pseudocercospora fijiensis CIRAD86]|uniref:Uncharacterized protein n=1 Tax=Pseudocercospora fijiensis (strain CIRAD86) TaxID=383855 RepID=N1Q9M3_PSEFD|nr:uncharacterized protein MYCFIDRAFT_206393 [Pseudocercospora fijiensis CIRAD86]EME89574.1 hypothetical protein MYCFIDRAFT_206393 [Pseudocercospora fijiensis CIRAD86]